MMQLSPAQVESVRLLRHMTVEDMVSYGGKAVLMLVAAVLLHFSRESYGNFASQCCLFASMGCVAIAFVIAQKEKQLVHLVQTSHPTVVRVQAFDPNANRIQLLTPFGPRLFQIHESEFKFLNQDLKNFRLNQRGRSAQKLLASGQFAGSSADMYLQDQEGVALIFVGGTALFLRLYAPLAQ